jgi:hypothetical protein
LFGGGLNSLLECTNRVDIYNTTSSTWTANLSQARSNAIALANLELVTMLASQYCSFLNLYNSEIASPQTDTIVSMILEDWKRQKQEEQAKRLREEEVKAL